jgi:hypothetical protein
LKKAEELKKDGDKNTEKATNEKELINLADKTEKDDENDEKDKVKNVMKDLKTLKKCKDYCNT